MTAIRLSSSGAARSPQGVHGSSEKPGEGPVFDGTKPAEHRQPIEMGSGTVTLERTYIMNFSRIVFTTLFSVASIACYGQASDTKPDNTKVNKRDRNSDEVTADQQKSNASDTDLTKKIRQSVIADKSLSTYAHNVKIISKDGAVTLKGPVKSDDEKKAIVAKAVAVTGSADKVTDQMSVER